MIGQGSTGLMFCLSIEPENGRKSLCSNVWTGKFRKQKLETRIYKDLSLEVAPWTQFAEGSMSVALYKKLRVIPLCAKKLY